MVKSFVLLFLALILFSGCSNNAQNSLEKAKLKGKVKTVISLAITFGNTSKTSIISNNNGKTDTQFTIIPPRIDTSKTIDNYTGKGNLIEHTIFVMNRIFKSKNIYDDGNRLLIDSLYDDEKLQSYTICEYDNKNNQTGLNEFNPDGSLRLKLKYTNKYDEKGNQIENDRFNAIGKLSKRTTYKYDGQGNQIETNVYSDDGKLLYRANTTYDSSSNCIEAIAYQPDSSNVTKTNYRYFDYDKVGNWLKQELYMNDSLYKIVQRTIEYYPGESPKR